MTQPERVERKNIVTAPESVSEGALSSLHFYPLKSGHGIQTAALYVREEGPFLDRELMLRSPNGKLTSQREVPEMATIQTKINEHNQIILAVEGHPDFVVTTSEESVILSAVIHQTEVSVADQGEAAAQWIQAVLGLAEGYRLVRRSDQHPRKISQSWIEKPEGKMTLADGYPILLTSEASLLELNTFLEQPIPMDRFRANIVVKDFPAWEEDLWEVIQIGEVIFDVVKPCARCPIPSVDQDTGERPVKAEPLKTLVQKRGPDQIAESAGTDKFKELKGGFFGWNLVPRNSGVITLSDTVKVVKQRQRIA